MGWDVSWWVGMIAGSGGMTAGSVGNVIRGVDTEINSRTPYVVAMAKRLIGITDNLLSETNTKHVSSRRPFIVNDILNLFFTYVLFEIVVGDALVAIVRTHLPAHCSNYLLCTFE